MQEPAPAVLHCVIHVILQEPVTVVKIILPILDQGVCVIRAM